MAFAFQPQDYMLRAQAGLPLDPSLSGDQVSAQAQQALSAPPPPPAAVPQPAYQQGGPAQGGPAPGAGQPYKPSAWDIIQGMLFNGGNGIASPQAAAMKAYGNYYAMMRAQQQAQELQKATGALRTGLLFGPEDTIKEYAKNLGPQNTPEGGTLTMFGGPTQQGGYSAVAPKLMMGPAGQPLALTQNGAVSLGPQLAGAKTLSPETGRVMDANLGLTGQKTAVFHTTPLGSRLTEDLGTLNAGAPGAPGSPAGPPATSGGQPGRFDAVNFIKSFILPHEGGLNPHDMNGAPSNFGINQTANPGVDVTKLTADQAAKIYQDKYLPMSGAANLSPALGAVHLDTSIINPARAQQFLQQSGGDPAKYLQLRQAWMDHMVQTNPAAAPYAHAWNQRNADLGSIINSQGQGAQPGATASGASRTIMEAQPPRLLNPAEVKAAGFADGTVVEKGADGKFSVTQAPQYDSAWDAQQKKGFQDDETVKQYRSVVQPSYQALIKNIGQMTGPAAYAILDTAIRTDNPGATTRQAQLDSFEHKFGLGGEVMGKLLNFQGKGSIPKDIQQKIIDSASSFAQAHYDAAQQLYKDQEQSALDHHRKVRDLTVSLGDRPERAIVAGPEGAIPESAALDQARQAIKQGRNPQMIRDRLQQMHIDPSKL